MPRLPLLLTVLCAAPSLALAQGSVKLQDVVELPKLGIDEADHATVAMNSNGDVFVAWHCRIRPGGPHQVEGVLMRRNTGLSWDPPQPADVLLLGDQSLGIFSPYEECTKPDVVALGTDFLVTWPRNEPYTGFSQLETALITVPPAGPVVVDSQMPGQGWIVEDNLVGGDAGLMPDLCARETLPGTAAVFYAEEVYSQASLREYEVRGTTIDFNVSPPVIGTPAVLATGIPVDNTNYGPTGGRVLVDAVEDDHGYFVFAFENFQLASHHNTPTDEGWIGVKRYAESLGTWTEYESQTYLGLDPTHRQRRPMLAASRVDTGNTVSVAWLEHGKTFLADIDVRYGELEFHGGASPGSVTMTNFIYPNLGGRDHALPVPIHSRNFRTVLCSRWWIIATGVVAFSAVPWIPERPLPTPVDWGWRPAADLLEIGAPGASGSRLISVSYEGESLTGSGLTAIYVQMFRS